MAKVYFEPYSAIKYVGTKAKEFSTSLARPKPTLKKGDIVIVDKKTAFNLTKKGFGEFKDVEEIEFVKSDTESANIIKDLNEKIEAFNAQNKELFAKLVDEKKENEALKAELAEALEIIAGEEPGAEE